MSCAAITLDTLQNVVHAAVRRVRQCLYADGGHFEHLLWIQNSRTSLISILLLYKYSSYDYRVIFFMSKCVYIILSHSVLSHSFIFFRFYFFYQYVCMVLFLFNNVIYVFLLLRLCILIVCLCTATLTEVFSCFFLTCKANARVKPAKTGHGPHSA